MDMIVRTIGKTCPLTARACSYPEILKCTYFVNDFKTGCLLLNAINNLGRLHLTSKED